MTGPGIRIDPAIYGWWATRPDREIAPPGLGFCEFCGHDVLPGDEITSVTDGMYAHYDCVPWDDEPDEEEP